MIIKVYVLSDNGQVLSEDVFDARNNFRKSFVNPAPCDFTHVLDGYEVIPHLSLLKSSDEIGDQQ